MSPLYPHLSIYVALCLSGQCRLVHSSPWNGKPIKWPFNAYNYIDAGNALTYIHIYIHRVSSTTTDHIDCGGAMPSQPVSWDDQIGSFAPTFLAFPGQYLKVAWFDDVKIFQN